VSLVANFVNTTNITLTWNAVSGAVGYVIARATSASGPYTYLQTVTETTYTDYGLSAATIYYYRVAAMNAAAASSSATEAVNSQQPPPATLTAVATNGQITLAWSAATNAASYTLKRGLSLGNETATVVSGYSGTTYTNTGLVNGITYYYVVTVSGAGGSSGNSPEASATPQVAGNGIWIGTSGGIWSATTNWNAGSIASGPGNTADFSTLALTGNLTVTLDSARTLSGLKLGDEAAMYDWTLTGTNTLTLGLNPSLNVVNDSATLSLPLAGTNGLSKVGAGTLILSGTTDTFTNGLTVNAGLVTLDYSAGGSPGTNLVAATNALTLGGGGVQMIGTTNGGSQSFNGVTLNAGNAVLAAASAAGSPLPVLNLGAISENAGGTVEFIGPATTNASGAVAASAVITTTTIPGAAEQLGGMGLGKNGAFATVGLYDWATTNTTTSPYTLVGGSQVAGFYQSAGVTSGGNYDVNSGGVNTIGNAAGANTLRFNQSATLTVNNNSFTFQDCQGILVTPNCGTNNETVSGAALGFERSSGYGSSYGVIWQNDTQDYLTISIVLGAGRQPGQYNGLVQAGPGTVVYSAANTYELGAYLNGGYSMVTAYTGFGQTNNGYTTVSPVRLNGGTVVGAATFTHDQAGLNARPFVLGNNGGGLAAAAGDTMTVDGVVGSAAGAGPLWIGIPAASANGNVPGLLPGSGANTANPAVYATGTVALTGANNYAGGTILDSGTLNFNGLYALGGANYGGLTFKGGTLQYAANFSGTNGSADVTAGGVTLAGNGTIDVNGNAVAYGGSLGNSGNGSLTVKSSVTGGSLTLAGANNYSGSTTITNVTVSANNASGSATGTGNVLVQNGGVLAGRGAIGGTVTVGSGGTLSVGNGTDALALGNALVLNSGSTMQLQIAHSPLTNSSVNVAATMTCGGTLIVTNIGSAALANGDSFQLYSAAGFTGSFGTLVLPSLATNLFWNTNLLLSAGTLVVATTASPTIGSLELSGTDLVVSGTGGLGDWTYVVLATTNLAPANWMPVATNQFDGSGNFNVTVTNAATASQIFYRLQVR
jgi:autotransporter-associated beta strand protein